MTTFRPSSDDILVFANQGLDTLAAVGTNGDLNIAMNNSNNSTNNSNSTRNDVEGATIASPIIMCLAGVVGNILALLVLRRTRIESQRLMFHTLVAALVWNDLTGILLTTPVTIASYINGLKMPGGVHLCRFNGLVMVCFGLSTPLIVGAMAVERFLFVKHTFFYTKHCAPGAARMLVFVLWGFVIIFGLLPLVGFGEYSEQYPSTWCFLNFNTTNPVYASYGYLYSGLILSLVLVMVACNLVVVLTLLRVRRFRRKHSSGSINSVLAADGVLDETMRQQATAKRRTQKDIELQMMVVVCTITAVFAVCWVPLMIHIQTTLMQGGQSDPLFGLVAIRLASVNQTLNPWLYVILRRTLIIRVKKVCCRWRRLLRKRTRPRQTPAVGTRRHQYVHVRNQLCHRNLFVGEEPDSQLLSDSIRKSLQLAVPGAMSLPDVMMLDTGRRGEQLPLPDIAKAQSFAGRVSHTDSCDLYDGGQYFADSHAECSCCRMAVLVVTDLDCSECVREREAARMQQLGASWRQGPYLHSVCPGCVPESTEGAEPQDTDMDVGGTGPGVTGQISNRSVQNLRHQSSENSSSTGNESDMKPISLCSKHAEEVSRASVKESRTVEDNVLAHDDQSSTKRPAVLELVPLKNLSKFSPGHARNGSGGWRKTRLDNSSSRTSSSLKSSSAGSSVKARQPLQQSSSLDAPAPSNSRPISPMNFYNKRVKPNTGANYVSLEDTNAGGDAHIDHNGKDIEEKEVSDNQDLDQGEVLPTETTTDDCGFFSSMPSVPTDSILLSESKTEVVAESPRRLVGKTGGSFGGKHKNFLARIGSKEKSSSSKTPRSGVLSSLPPKPSKPHTQQKPPQQQNINQIEASAKSHMVHDSPSGHTSMVPGDCTSFASPSPGNSPEAATRKDSQGSSGIFSDESPAAAGRKQTVRPTFSLDGSPIVTHKKQPVRHVNSTS